MEEDTSRGFMSRIGTMDLEFVNTVRVVIAQVASDLDRVGYIDILELPLRPGSSFLDMIHLLESLKMLVCLAMELEVSLETCLVGT